jgi:hypothetical protein
MINKMTARIKDPFARSNVLSNSDDITDIANEIKTPSNNNPPPFMRLLS